MVALGCLCSHREFSLRKKKGLGVGFAIGRFGIRSLRSSHLAGSRTTGGGHVVDAQRSSLAEVAASQGLGFPYDMLKAETLSSTSLHVLTRRMSDCD